jgi:starvation-inducible DNA-binding protein
LHLQLDELIDVWRELGDTVAERAVAIGHFPDGQARTVASAAVVTPVGRGPILWMLRTQLPQSGA